MKVKLTLNINERIIKKAKQVSARKKVSLSAVVEEYLAYFSGESVPQKSVPKKNSITQRIRKLTRPVAVSDSELKEMRAKHLQSKYGKE
ncbi:MAG: hypothetical protein J7502_09865 [Flavisolibacter sp.]|nr:hypothetical protein [Flavisolibacter sp.]